MPSSRHAKPSASAAVAMPIFSSLAIELGQRVEGGGLSLAGAQEVEQALAPAGALGHQQHAVRRALEVLLQRASGSFGAAHHAKGGSFCRTRRRAPLSASGPQQLRMGLGAL
jgi:hypothetical protein